MEYYLVYKCKEKCDIYIYKIMYVLLYTHGVIFSEKEIVFRRNFCILGQHGCPQGHCATQKN